MTTAKQQETKTRKKVAAETKIYRDAFHGTCDKSLVDMKGISRALSCIAEGVAKIEQRAITGKMLDEATWTIWGYCREHLQSMESSPHCKKIRGFLDAAVADVQSKLEATQKELRGERTRYRACRTASMATIEELETRIKEIEE